LILKSGKLESMCVVGTYLHFPARHYCGESHEGFSPATCTPNTAACDDFKVSVYATRTPQIAPTDPTANNMPGELVGTSATTVLGKGYEFAFGSEKYYRIQLQLTTPIPAVGNLEAGRVYWIEFVNNTDFGEQGCNWWTGTAAAGEGNGILLSDTGLGLPLAERVYTQEDVVALDFPFCMNLPFEPPPTPERACCSCGPPAACTVATLEECLGEVGGTVPGLGVEWVLDQLTCDLPYECPGVPANDLCANAFVVSDGKHNFRNRCAETDGPTPVQCLVNVPTDPPTPPETNSTPFLRDVWFKYTASCTGQLRVSTCDREQYLDSVLAVYHDPGSATLCPCPTDASLQVGLCSDDDTETCEMFQSSSELSLAVTAGNCYTIRVGGFDGAQDEGRLTLQCAPTGSADPSCGNNVVDGGEDCDGTANGNCPGKVCRAGSSIGANCNTDSDCPGSTTVPRCKNKCLPSSDYNGCTCYSTCGNNSTEFGEDCDGGNCPGGANCRPPNDPLGGCTCPPDCGNGIKEGSELCDPDTDHAGANPDDSLCPNQCQGDCTCFKDCGDGIAQVGEQCDGATPAVNHPCPGRCEADCTCPPAFCGNNIFEALTNQEECEFGACTVRKCSNAPTTTCTVDLDCAPGTCDRVPCDADADCTAVSAGTCNLALDREDCDGGACRPPGDPVGECTCACASATVPAGPVWAPAKSCASGANMHEPCATDADCPPGTAGICDEWPNNNPDATPRSLRFTIETPSAATGSGTQSAIKVTMVDLQNPNPPNLPANPPPNFSGYESGTCSPRTCIGGSRNGLTCVLPAPTPTDCPAPGVCTAAVESNSCARWVGKPGTFRESQDNLGIGTYRAARLQCSPFYFDWITETATGPIAVVGGEIAPSSEYSVQAYAATCKGVEAGCADVSAAVTMYTRRSGDVELPFQGPSPAPLSQPNVTDIAQLVNKFNIGGLLKAVTQLQPNLLELNADINSLDIVAVVDAVKQAAYAYSGPCTCPSTVKCGPAAGSVACANATICIANFGNAATCVKTCVGGANDGDPCIDFSRHCPGGTSCGNAGATPGYCRDRCGRCTP